MFRLKILALLGGFWGGVMGMAGLTAAMAQDAADIIVLNADIRTVDPAKPRADALAVKDGRFIAVGRAEFITDLRGPATQVIDAGGRTLIPGIADAHAHLLQGAELYRGVDLFGMKDLSSWLEAIRKKDRELPKGVWMIGGRWDSTAHVPTRQDLDAIAPDRPIALYDTDYHTLWVNSKALELAGVDKNVQAPAGGEVGRDKKGELSGILKETATQLIMSSPAFKNAQSPKVVDYAKVVQHYNSLGITSVHDMFDNLDDYEKLLKDNTYNLRVWYGFMAPTDAAAMRPESFAAFAEKQKSLNDEAKAREEKEGLGPKYRFGYLKYFIDGTLAFYTAALNEPYSDRHDGFTGNTVQSPEQLNTIVTNANNAGFPVAVHAIGDRGVDLALDAFAQSPEKRGKFNRIEHIEVYSKGTARRFYELGVVASMQPDHAIDGDFQEARLGRERLPRSYAWQSILTNGGMLVLGSDWPTAKESPMLQLGDAVMRQRHGKEWYGENALSFDEALYAYTQAPAIISGWQDELGSISVGKLADFVILQGKIQDNPMTDIRGWKVDQTWFAGKKVYERIK